MRVVSPRVLRSLLIVGGLQTATAAQEAAVRTEAALVREWEQRLETAGACSAPLPPTRALAPLTPTRMRPEAQLRRRVQAADQQRAAAERAREAATSAAEAALRDAEAARAATTAAVREAESAARAEAEATLTARTAELSGQLERARGEREALEVRRMCCCRRFVSFAPPAPLALHALLRPAAPAPTRSRRSWQRRVERLRGDILEQQRRAATSAAEQERALQAVRIEVADAEQRAHASETAAQVAEQRAEQLGQRMEAATEREAQQRDALQVRACGCFWWRQRRSRQCLMLPACHSDCVRIIERSSDVRPRRRRQSGSGSPHGCWRHRNAWRRCAACASVATPLRCRDHSCLPPRRCAAGGHVACARRCVRALEAICGSFPRAQRVAAAACNNSHAAGSARVWTPWQQP